MLSAQLEVEKLVQSATDSATSLTGAEFGSFFYNVENAEGESYMLYTIVRRPDRKIRKLSDTANTAIFGSTFRGEGTVRIDDVKKDPRYGKNPPYHGMPEGHLPVTSYLAVPVKSASGDVIGGLFFGHSAVGVFTRLHEQIVEGLAAQTAIAMDNARLYESAKNTVREKGETSSRANSGCASRPSKPDGRRTNFSACFRTNCAHHLNSILGWTQMLNSRQLDEEMFSRAVETISVMPDCRQNLSMTCLTYRG